MDRIKLLQNHLSHLAITPTTYSKILVESLDNGSIGVISLNSPNDLNVISVKLVNEVMKAVKVYNEDPKVKVILLKSQNPKVFCAGGDLKGFMSATFEGQCLEDFLEDADKGFATCKKPIISVINGAAFGGGLELALAGDIILMSENARIGLPEIKYGMIPGLGGTQRPAKLIGKHNAMKILLTGDSMSANEAYRLGICQGVHKNEDFFNEALKLARDIAEKPVYAIVAAKKAIKFGEEVGLTEGLRLEREEINALFSTKGKEEGVKAFLEKRKPDFKDK